ncbi:MAG: rRNA maturation RNase YbeY [Clostridium perfringens]|nr:rRNA maturation RNase YbeY [Clostridium perfringens]
MIFIDNRQNKIDVSDSLTSHLEKVIYFVLKEESVKEECEISLVFVDNHEIKDINRETRNIDKATDVLSFPMLDYEKGKVYKDLYLDFKFDSIFFDDGKLVLGDIVISLEKSLEQSIEFNHSFFRETSYLVIHSVLHLLGYDHMEEDEKKVMREREEVILEKLNIPRE